MLRLETITFNLYEIFNYRNVFKALNKVIILSFERISYKA
jgi:hypothetical protein